MAWGYSVNMLTEGCSKDPVTLRFGGAEMKMDGIRFGEGAVGSWILGSGGVGLIPEVESFSGLCSFKNPFLKFLVSELFK